MIFCFFPNIIRRKCKLHFTFSFVNANNMLSSWVAFHPAKLSFRLSYCSFQANRRIAWPKKYISLHKTSCGSAIGASSIALALALSLHKTSCGSAIGASSIALALALSLHKNTMTTNHSKWNHDKVYSSYSLLGSRVHACLMYRNQQLRVFRLIRVRKAAREGVQQPNRLIA